MDHRPRRRRAPLALAGATAAALLAASPAAASQAPATPTPAPSTLSSPGPATAGPEACSPGDQDRPVCEVGNGGAGAAAFLDPTATVLAPGSVSLAEHVYVAPFATLDARGAPLELGAESDVQDGVEIVAAPHSDHDRQAALSAASLGAHDGVVTGERVALAHGSGVRGPARLGAGPELEGEDGGVFLSFGSLVDGAVLERDTVLSALSRVGPGVVLRSGTVVLPGKDVRTQTEADDPALGKVRPVTGADREFNAAVVEVNVGLAREYSTLALEDPSAVRGANVDPGGNPFNVARDLPSVGSDLCTGPEVREPRFRNRVIGEICFEDSRDRLRSVMGDRVSLRADEGGPFGIGAVQEMGDGVILHALEESTLQIGDRVSYGEDVIVHGGGRPATDATTGEPEQTVIGNDVVLGDGALVFRSLVRNGASVGERSAVVGSELALGQEVPARTVYADGEVFGPVEW